MNLTSLETSVMHMLLAGDDEVLAVLRRQLGNISVTSRKMTGAGFYAEFLHPPDVERITDLPSFKFGDVDGRASNLKHGAGFLLYVTQGVLSMLEGYTYDEPWPDEVKGLVLHYRAGQNRSLDELIKILHGR